MAKKLMNYLSEKLRVTAVVTATTFTALSLLALVSRKMLDVFQKQEGLLLLSGLPRARFYEWWAIDVPTMVSILCVLGAIAWTSFKIFKWQWPKSWLFANLLYVFAFLYFQFFLLGLEFEAFD